MKAIFFSVLLTASISCSYAQVSETAVSPANSDHVFQVVEQMPEFPGGQAALMKFLQMNIRYPDMERDNDIQGRVVVGFIVNEDGSVSDIEVKKSVSKGMDKEAVRVVSLLPKFKPGKQQGKAVRVAYVLPIMFKLTEATKPKPLVDSLHTISK